MSPHQDKTPGRDAHAGQDPGLTERVREVVRHFGAKRVSKAAGVSHETIRRIVSLGHTPTVRLISGLCTELGVNGDWLLLGKGPRMTAHVTSTALREASTTEILAAVSDQCRLRVEALGTLEEATGALSVETTSAGEMEALRHHVARVTDSLRLLAEVAQHAPRRAIEVVVSPELPRLVAESPPQEARGG